MAPRTNPSLLSSRCPRCGEDAPLVYREYVPTCSACGVARVPLTAPAVAMAGKPSQVGGTVARVVGWSVLAGGGFLSAALFAILTWAIPGSPLAWIVTTPVLVLTMAMTVLLVKGGKSLSQSGERKEIAVRRKALDAIVRQRRGVVTAEDVAGNLRMSIPQIDAWLTELAKSEPEEITLEVDDNGRVTYRFTSYAPDTWRAQMDHAQEVQAAHARVATEPQVFDAEFVEDAAPTEHEPSFRSRR